MEVVGCCWLQVVSNANINIQVLGVKWKWKCTAALKRAICNKSKWNWLVILKLSSNIRIIGYSVLNTRSGKKKQDLQELCSLLLGYFLSQTTVHFLKKKKGHMTTHWKCPFASKGCCNEGLNSQNLATSWCGMHYNLERRIIFSGS